jgi:hypothetical protein
MNNLDEVCEAQKCVSVLVEGFKFWRKHNAVTTFLWALEAFSKERTRIIAWEEARPNKHIPHSKTDIMQV